MGIPKRQRRHTGNGEQQDGGHEVSTNIEVMRLVVDVDGDHTTLISRIRGFCR
jgi:hypothetical protein